MAEVEIKVRHDGPYKVTGPVRLIDADGNEFELPDDGRPLALCRCGGGEAKPVCGKKHPKNGVGGAGRGGGRGGLGGGAGGGGAGGQPPPAAGPRGGGAG